MGVVGSQHQIPPRPEIRRYTCYRRFMLDFYQYKKTHRSGFSYRKFAGLAGVKSPNYLQLIMKGGRNLSVDLAHAVAQAMGLEDAERDYFVSLVRQENAKSDEELRFAEKESLRAVKKLCSSTVEDQGFRVLDKWCHLAIRELSFLQDFEPTPQYVVRKLNGLVTLDEAEESLKLLKELGVLILEKGKWRAKNPVIDTGNGFLMRELALKFHQQNLGMWAKHLDKARYENVETGLLNISLPQSKVAELREKLREFQDELIGWLDGVKEPDSTVQVGVYMVPLASDKK